MLEGIDDVSSATCSTDSNGDLYYLALKQLDDITIITDRLKKVARERNIRLPDDVNMGPAAGLASAYDLESPVKGDSRTLGRGIQKTPGDRARQIRKWHLAAQERYHAFMAGDADPLPGMARLDDAVTPRDEPIDALMRSLEEEVCQYFLYLNACIEALEHDRPFGPRVEGEAESYHLGRQMNKRPSQTGSTGASARVDSGLLAKQARALADVSDATGAVFIARDVAPQARVVQVGEAIGVQRKPPEGSPTIVWLGKRTLHKDKTDKQSLHAAQLMKKLSEVRDQGLRVFDPVSGQFLNGMQVGEEWVKFSTEPDPKNIHGGREVIVISQPVSSKVVNQFVNLGYSRLPVLATDQEETLLYERTLLIESPERTNVWRLVPRRVTTVKPDAEIKVVDGDASDADFVSSSRMAPSFWTEELVERFGQWDENYEWDLLVLSAGSTMLGKGLGEYTFLVGEYDASKNQICRMVSDVDLYAVFPRIDDGADFESRHHRVDLGAHFPDSTIEGYGVPSCVQLMDAANAKTNDKRRGNPAAMGRTMVEHSDDAQSPFSASPPEKLYFSGPGGDTYFADTQEAVGRAMRYLAETGKLRIYAHRDWKTLGQDYEAVYQMRTRVVDRTGCDSYFEDTAETIDEQVRIAGMLADRGEQHVASLITWCEEECQQLEDYMQQHRNAMPERLAALATNPEKRAKLEAAWEKYQTEREPALRGHLTRMRASLAASRRLLVDAGCCGLWRVWHDVSVSLGCESAPVVPATPPPPEVEPLSQAGLALLYGDRPASPSSDHSDLTAAGVRRVSSAGDMGLASATNSPERKGVASAPTGRTPPSLTLPPTRVLPTIVAGDTPVVTPTERGKPRRSQVAPVCQLIEAEATGTKRETGAATATMG